MAPMLATFFGILVLVPLGVISADVAKDVDLPVFGASYSPLIRPDDGGPPVQVGVTLYITVIEIEHNEIEAKIYLRQTWKDSRLKHNKDKPMTLKAESVLPRFWTPDLFFPNANDHPEIINKGFLRVSATGDVLYSQLLKHEFTCPGASLHFAIMNGGKFNCSIEIESYSYSTEDMVVKWANPKGAVAVAETAVINELYKLGSFQVSERNIALSTGNYSRISVSLEFEANVQAPPVAYMHLLQKGGKA